MLDENSAEVNDSIPDVTPLGRKGTVDELAETTLWLASDAGSYVTGLDQISPVDQWNPCSGRRSGR